MPVSTWTNKFRLSKPAPGTLDWWGQFYENMDIIDKHVPRIFMSAPRVVLLTLQAGGTLTAGRYYYYKVVAFQDSGCTIETLASWELTSALADITNKTIKVDWSAITGAVKYRVYRYDTVDAGYVPLDSDFLFLATVSAPTASYTDTGAVTPGGAMPTTLNWYVTEIDPTYVIPVSETSPSALVGSPADLSDNLTNIRRMIKLLNGETNWNTTPYSSFAYLRDGKSGGQMIVGGTANTDHLDLKANAPGGGVGQIRMNSSFNMLGFTLYGHNVANQHLILQASSHATNGGTIYLMNNADITGNIVISGNVDGVKVATHIHNATGTNGPKIATGDLTGHDKAAHDALGIAAADSDKLDAQHGTYYLARANHTGTQAIATLSDHNKANHDALSIIPGDGTVSTVKIADYAVIYTKLSGLNQWGAYYNAAAVAIATSPSVTTLATLNLNLTYAGKFLVMAQCTFEAFDAVAYFYIKSGSNAIKVWCNRLNVAWQPVTICDIILLSPGNQTIEFRAYLTSGGAASASYRAMNIIAIGGN